MKNIMNTENSDGSNSWDYKAESVRCAKITAIVFGAWGTAVLGGCALARWLHIFN